MDIARTMRGNNSKWRNRAERPPACHRLRVAINQSWTWCVFIIVFCVAVTCQFVYQSHRALASARTDYERIHDRLMQEIPQLLEGRVDYFDTCLFAVIKAQVCLFLYCDCNYYYSFLEFVLQ